MARHLQRPKNNLQAFLSNETQPKAVIATLATQLSTKSDAKLPPVTSSHVITNDQLSAVGNAAATADASTADVTRSPHEGETAAGRITGPVRKGTSFPFLFLFSSIEVLF
jgi:hypothetical protein